MTDHVIAAPLERGRLAQVYAVVIEDRHSDVEVELFSEQSAAHRRAQEVADTYGSPDPDDDESTLNDAMNEAGWTFYCRYSTEGDCVRVQPLEVR